APSPLRSRLHAILACGRLAFGSVEPARLVLGPVAVGVDVTCTLVRVANVGHRLVRSLAALRRGGPLTPRDGGALARFRLGPVGPRRALLGTRTQALGLDRAAAGLLSELARLPAAGFAAP